MAGLGVVVDINLLGSVLSDVLLQADAVLASLEGFVFLTTSSLSSGSFVAVPFEVLDPSDLILDLLLNLVLAVDSADLRGSVVGDLVDHNALDLVPLEHAVYLRSND